MKQVLIFLIGVNALALFMAVFNINGTQQPISFQNDCLPNETTNNTIIPRQKFDNPLIAYHLLEKLDFYENADTNLGENEDKRLYYFGTKINNYYCDEHRSYFVNNPGYIFTEKNFMTEISGENTIRNTIMPSIGNDLHPDIGPSMSQEIMNSYIEGLRPDITIFYNSIEMWKYRLLGKQFSCLTQISNHCPGNENLILKDKAGQALVEYAKEYESRPQCFNTDKLFPQTWIMKNTEQCHHFFEVFNSPEYFKLKGERNIVYLRKISDQVHKDKGVFSVNNEEEKYLRALYNNGANCGSITENNIIQTFIHNPLLLQNKKIHLQTFLFLASTNPFIAYYHDGYLRIPSIESNNDAYWSFHRFHAHLMEKGRVNDPNWLDNYLRVEMKKAMVHLIRMSQGSYWRKSSINELYAIDFMMDEDLNLWFIEANSEPLAKDRDVKTKEFFNKMLIDSFEIAFGLLRSRTKRIINYINELTKREDDWIFVRGGLALRNLHKRREELRQLTMNYFEPEFVPSQDNGFHQIMDENLGGTERYFKLLEEECL